VCVITLEHPEFACELVPAVSVPKRTSVKDAYVEAKGPILKPLKLLPLSFIVYVAPAIYPVEGDASCVNNSRVKPPGVDEEVP